MPPTPDPALGPPDPQAAARSRPSRTSALASLAFAFALPGFFLLPFALVAALFGALALRRIGRDSSLGGRKLAIAALVSVPVSLALTTGLGVIGYRGFRRFTRHAFEADGINHMEEISDALRARALDRGDVPSSIAPTPTTVPCPSSPWPTDAPAAWRDLGFGPESPVHFSYELITDPARRTFTVRATGDLDCDGVTRVFELGGGVDDEERPRRPVRVEGEPE